MTQKPQAYIDPTYSEDDGGWYAEVIGEVGNDLHTTDVTDTRDGAIGKAYAWCTKVGFANVPLY